MPRAVAFSRQQVAVAIPARDEEDHIGVCLDAIDRQTVRPNITIVLLNNCTDATEKRMRAMTPGHVCEIASVEFSPSHATAGYARRLAMKYASRHIGSCGVLMTTDADAIVPPDWIERNLAAIAAGADAVCGRAVLTDRDAAMIPQHLHDDDALEQHLLTLTDRIAWLVDPDPIDPPPRHTEASGASIAVRAAAWHRAGGIPALRNGEDRGFITALRRVDAGIRHDPAIEVVVSGRTIGRADGGMADTIRRRMIVQDEFADDQLEPPEDALHRLRLRARLRAAWQNGAADPSLAKALGISTDLLRHLLQQRYFGVAWEVTSGLGVLAERRPVRFVELPQAIARAEQLLASLAPPDRLAAD